MSRRARHRRGPARRLLQVAVVTGVLAAGAGIAYAWSTASTNPGNSITGATLGAPTGLGTVRTPATGSTCTTVDVSWTAAPNANRYRVEVQVGAGPWTTLAASHASTTYSDTTGYTNSSMTWRITPVVAGSATWAGTPATVSLACGVGDVVDLVATNACNTSELTWSAPPNADRYDVQRRVNGGAWTALATDQAGTTYSDATVHASGSVVDYQVRPGNATNEGNWSTAATIASWDVFRITSVTFGNVATLGTLEAGDTVVLVFNKPVATTSMTNTQVFVKNSNPAGNRGVYIAATSDQANKTQAGRVAFDVFSAAVGLAGTTAWSNGNTTWTWTSSGGGTTMSAGLSTGTWTLGSDAGLAKCAANPVVEPAATAPTLAGRW